MSDIQAAPYHDRIVREEERLRLTGLSRVRAWEMERLGAFPKRRKLHSDGRAVGWLYSELMEWIKNLPVVHQE